MNTIEDKMLNIFDLNVSLVLFKTPSEEIERCVSSIINSNQKSLITLINNGGSDQSYPKSVLENVKIIDVGENLGYGKAHNIALNNTSISCRYNLILNSDLHFAGSDIDELVKFMDENHEVGMVSPRITYPNGEIQKLCRLLPSPVTVFGRAFLPFLPFVKKLDREYQFGDWSYADLGNFPYLSGCFMLVRRKVVEKVGVFDERYFMFFEDVDFSRRIHSFYKTVFYPKITIQHDYRSKQKFSLKLLFYKINSAIKYFSKWGWTHDIERERVNTRALKQFDSFVSQNSGDSNFKQE